VRKPRSSRPLESKIASALMFMPGWHICFNVNGQRLSLSVLSRVYKSGIRNGLRCQQCDALIQRPSAYASASGRIENGFPTPTSATAPMPAASVPTGTGVPVPREDSFAKGRHLLVEGRLLIRRVDDSTVLAECRGDSGEIYALTSDQERWTCSCPAVERCSHAVALRLVVVRPTGARETMGR
jgi:hypothetical protein